MPVPMTRITLHSVAGNGVRMSAIFRSDLEKIEVFLPYPQVETSSIESTWAPNRALRVLWKIDARAAD